MQPLKVSPVYEDGNCYILGYVTDLSDGGAILQADLSSITLKVYDAKSPGSAATYDSTLTISATIFDTLQTGLGWSAATGFNLKVLVTPAMIPRGGTTYRFEFKFTTTGGLVMFSVVELPTIGLFQS